MQHKAKAKTASNENIQVSIFKRNISYPASRNFPKQRVILIQLKRFLKLGNKIYSGTRDCYSVIISPGGTNLAVKYYNILLKKGQESGIMQGEEA